MFQATLKLYKKSNVVVEDPNTDMINDAFGMHEYHLEEGSHTLNKGIRLINNVAPNVDQVRNTVYEFYELSNDAKQPLYKGVQIILNYFSY